MLRHQIRWSWEHKEKADCARSQKTKTLSLHHGNLGGYTRSESKSRNNRRGEEGGRVKETGGREKWGVTQFSMTLTRRFKILENNSVSDGIDRLSWLWSRPASCHPDHTQLTSQLWSPERACWPFLKVTKELRDGADLKCLDSEVKPSLKLNLLLQHIGDQRNIWFPLFLQLIRVRQVTWPVCSHVWKLIKAGTLNFEPLEDWDLHDPKPRAGVVM